MMPFAYGQPAVMQQHNQNRVPDMNNHWGSNLAE
jgi:hypothetical protein